MSKNLTRMTTRTRRKNRPETLLRLLMSTSYPHSTLADLMFLMNRHAGPTDREELCKMADDFTEVERKFGMFDFIRAVEVLRNGQEVKIIVRQLDLDPTAREIVDDINTHVELASGILHLEDTTTSFTDLDIMAEQLLQLFRSTQREDMRTERTWQLRQRPGPKGNAKLGNRSVPAVDETVDHATAVALVASSLAKNRFHMVLTHNTVLLFDQQRSLK